MKIITQIPKKLIAILILLMLSASVILLKGCGSTKDDSTGCRSEQIAPAGSTITVSPTTVSQSGAGGNTLLWTVVILDPVNKLPMNGICFTVSGAFAAPNTVLPLYAFLDKDKVQFNSGGTEKTNNAGYYTFGTLITAGSGTWSESNSIHIRSGTADTAVSLSCAGC